MTATEFNKVLLEKIKEIEKLYVEFIGNDNEKYLDIVIMHDQDGKTISANNNYWDEKKRVDIWEHR